MRLTTLTILVSVLILPVSAQYPGGMPGDPNPNAVQIGVPGALPQAAADDGKKIEESRPVMKRETTVANRVAATVNGRPITANEVSFRMRPIAMQLATLYPRQGPEFVRQLTEAKKSIIDDLIERELVLSHFDTQGYQFPDSAIDQELKREIMANFNGDRDLFLKGLKESGLTLRTYREMTRKRMIVGAMRQQKYDMEIPPTPDEINKEYAETKFMYRDLVKDRIKFKKIFIPLHGNGPLETPEVQMDLADLVANEIRSKKATFEEMAKKYSRDAKAGEGGDWPIKERSELAAEFAAILFDAKEGAVVGPLIDPNGFTIALVEKKIMAPAPPLSKIKEQVDGMVRSKRSNERYIQWIDRLRKKAIIKTYI